MRTAILFDLAGVLVEWDPSPLYRAVFDGDEVRERTFFSDIMTAEVQAEISCGRALDSVVTELSQRYPEFAAAIEAWDQRWNEMLVGEIKGTIALLKELKQSGYPKYILGNWSREEFNRAKARFDFLSEFNGIVISGDHGVMKPDPALFGVAIEQFRLDPPDTIFVDDKAANIASAQRLGFQTILFQDPVQLRWELSQRGILT